jgi:two-component system, chemotaxis family, protein-glutamate methylesterase/glutaminase
MPLALRRNGEPRSLRKGWIPEPVASPALQNQLCRRFLDEALGAICTLYHVVMTSEALSGRDIIAVGASAGGLDPLRTLLNGLPADLPASLFVVMHLPPQSPGLLGQILARGTGLRVGNAAHGDPIEHGRVYVAPPDHHLLVRAGSVEVVHGPRENGHRPGVDPLFRSAAVSYGPRVVGVILSGSLDDGTAGLMAIKRCGGMAVVQEPDEAQFKGMPISALANVRVDHRLRLNDIPPLLLRLVREAPPADAFPHQAPQDLALESGMPAMTNTRISALESIGTLSAFTCPECNGALWELSDAETLRFRCHVGHAFIGDTLIAAKSEDEERALWTALRTLVEQAALFRRMAKRVEEQGASERAERFMSLSQERERNAEVLRRMLHQRNDIAAELRLPASNSKFLTDEHGG